MISLELSMVEHNRSKSAELAAAMEEFLLRGGQVSEAPNAIPAPRPHVYSSAQRLATLPRPPKQKPDKKVTMQRLRITPDIEEAKARKRDSYDVSSIREMAKTLSQGEVVVRTGIHRKQLYLLAKEHGFAFQEPAHDGTSNLVIPKIDPAADARNVERIKAFRDIGVTRKQAAKRMGISTTLLYRLIRDFNIDYPVTMRGAA